MFGAERCVAGRGGLCAGFLSGVAAGVAAGVLFLSFSRLLLCSVRAVVALLQLMQLLLHFLFGDGFEGASFFHETSL